MTPGLYVQKAIELLENFGRVTMCKMRLCGAPFVKRILRGFIFGLRFPISTVD